MNEAEGSPVSVGTISNDNKNYQLTYNPGTIRTLKYSLSQYHILIVSIFYGESDWKKLFTSINHNSAAYNTQNDDIRLTMT